MTNAGHDYAVHGVCLRSNVEFPGFIPVLSGRPEITLVLRPPEDTGLGRLPQEAVLLESVYDRPDGAEYPFVMYRFPSHYVLRWSHLSDFWLRKDGARIEIHPWTGVPWSHARPFLLGRILPLALNLRGTVTLHGGAIVTPRGATAFVGSSGSGKSTLLASFAARGCSVLADDVLAVTTEGARAWAYPGSSHIRLAPDSLDFLSPGLAACGEPEADYDKSRVCLRHATNGIGNGGFPLRAVYFLDRTSGQANKVVIEQLPQRESLATLLKHTNNLQLMERAQVRDQFSRLLEVARQVPVERLEYPSGFDSLSEVCAAVLEDQATN